MKMDELSRCSQIFLYMHRKILCKQAYTRKFKYKINTDQLLEKLIK